MEYYKNLSLENLTGYDDDGNFIVEVWKDIENYENMYQISTFGRAKALERIVSCGGDRAHLKVRKERILKQFSDGRYLHIVLSIGANKKTRNIHRLVAETFIPNPENKKTVDHLKSKLDNRVFKLKWATSRENSESHFIKRKSSTSKYVGVHFDKKNNKWVASIRIGKKLYHLGSFLIEIDAHYAYQKALKEVENGTFILK